MLDGFVPSGLTGNLTAFSGPNLCKSWNAYDALSIEDIEDTLIG